MNRRTEILSNYWGAFILGWFKYLNEADFNGSDYRVLFYICEQINAIDNTAHLLQRDISRELHMDRANVSRSIKKLYKEQFIAKSSTGFMVNPHLFYIGKGRKIERDILRRKFGNLLSEKQIAPRFNLNEDEHILEKLPNIEEESGVFNEGFST